MCLQLSSWANVLGVGGFFLGRDFNGAIKVIGESGRKRSVDEAGFAKLPTAAGFSHLGLPHMVYKALERQDFTLKLDREGIQIRFRHDQTNVVPVHFFELVA